METKVRSSKHAKNWVAYAKIISDFNKEKAIDFSVIVKLHFSSSSDMGCVWSEILLVPASWAADTDGEAASSHPPSWQRELLLWS